MDQNSTDSDCGRYDSVTNTAIPKHKPEFLSASELVKTNWEQVVAGKGSFGETVEKNKSAGEGRVPWSPPAV